MPETSAEPEAPPVEKKEDKGSALWRVIKGLLWLGIIAVVLFVVALIIGMVRGRSSAR